MTHAIEPGDVVRFNSDSPICRNALDVIGDVTPTHFTVQGGVSWWPLSDVTLIAKGLENVERLKYQLAATVSAHV